MRVIRRGLKRTWSRIAADNFETSTPCETYLGMEKPKAPSEPDEGGSYTSRRCRTTILSSQHATEPACERDRLNKDRRISLTLRERSIDILYHRPINFFKNPKPDYPWITLHGIGEHGHASAQHRTKSRGTEPLSPIVMVVGRLRDFRARRSTLGGISCGKESNDPVTDFGLEIQGRILGFLLFTSLHHIHDAEVSKRRKEGLCFFPAS
ncbi:hypothetical protein F5051DRAFT_503768 [Lentinula edodes]|nr:hypothetical protein F5051DRAFT_503768 [Lentinula edodes]